MYRMAEAEELTLTDRLTAAVMEHCQAQGGGFPLAFVGVVEWADAEGVQTISVAEPAAQSTAYSLGLANYLGKWFEDDAVNTWYAQIAGGGDAGD